MHRRISLFAPSSSGISALALKLVVATGVHAFPNRTASERQHPSWVLALPNFVKVASANINGMVVKI